MSRQNKTRFAILGTLAIEPQTGYDIRKFLTKSGGFWQESNGQIYPMLKKLQNEAMVEKSVIIQDGKPNRNVFEITELGREALRQWLSAEVAPARSRNELLLKLYFGPEMEIADSIAHVERYKRDMSNDLAELTAIETNLEQVPESLQKAYWLMTLRHGQYYMNSLIGWADETLARLAQLA